MPSIQIFWNISVTEFPTPHPGVWYHIDLVLSGDFNQNQILGLGGVLGGGGI